MKLKTYLKHHFIGDLIVLIFLAGLIYLPSRLFARGIEPADNTALPAMHSGVIAGGKIGVRG